MNSDNPEAPVYVPYFLVLGDIPPDVRQAAMGIGCDSPDYLAAFQDWIRTAKDNSAPTLYRSYVVPTSVNLYAEVYNLQPGPLTYRLEVEDPNAPVEEAFLWADSREWYANENGASVIAHGTDHLWFPRAGRYKASLYIDNYLAREAQINVANIDTAEALNRVFLNGFNGGPTKP